MPDSFQVQQEQALFRFLCGLGAATYRSHSRNHCHSVHLLFPMSDTVLRTGLTNTMRQFILCPLGHLQFCGRASILLSSLIPETSLCALIEQKFLLHFCLFVCFSSVSCISSASMEAPVLVVQLDLPISSLAQDSAPFLDPTLCPIVSCWSRLRDLFNYPVCAQHTHTHRVQLCKPEMIHCTICPRNILFSRLNFGFQLKEMLERCFNNTVTEQTGIFFTLIFLYNIKPPLCIMYLNIK